jgi:hypothetical protein
MNQKRIVIDGKVYNNIDEMPEEIRQQYLDAMRKLDANNNGKLDMLENVNAFFEDKNKDGVPDAFDNLMSLSNTVTTAKIIADGKEYNGMDQLPPEVRAKLSQAMSKLDANQNGIPDFMESAGNIPNQRTDVASSASIGTGTPLQTPSKLFSSPQASSAIEPEPASSGWMIALAGLFIFMLCAAVAFGAWYFFLR